ncbi:permease [Cohnella sp. CFH 77786]|uniref:permease n=1 Tax=Cohnella sp. CFH 77786 TaxID=2662265 RepID=UPI001C60FE5D|nr:permease [Cohnella sp. CFH 77786]MBW5446321.1 permease [Cohnella sp. CFH 77786]
MSQMSGLSLQPETKYNAKTVAMVLVFILIAAAGLMYVKWWPYYNKALSSAATHSIGSSILGDPAGDAGSPTWSDAVEYAAKYFKSVWKAAILGILLGSLVQVLIPVRWLQRVMGSNRFKSTFIGGIVSLPGMMCSCCAAPIAAGLRRRNVSAGAAIAFWLGNPLLNPATLIFMTFVLSWKFTLLRIGFGILMTFGIGYLANRLMRGKEVNAPEGMQPKPSKGDSGSFGIRWLKSLGIMVLQVVPAYLAAVLLLGAMKVWMFPVTEGSGLAILILFAVCGALFVIPTAAEIPIAQSFLSAGIGAGPVAALLLTLPAVSLPSLLMVAKAFPRRILALVLGSVILAGIAGGIVGVFVL